MKKEISMNKRIFSVVLSALMLANMTACKEKKEEKSIENTEIIIENEKITVKKEKKSKKKPKISFPIAINTASLDVLCAIPGVGPKMAEKIISYRKTHGPLKKEADLLKISGIGKKKSKIILIFHHLMMQFANSLKVNLQQNYILELKKILRSG